jgi:hypothetical protein
MRLTSGFWFDGILIVTIGMEELLYDTVLRMIYQVVRLNMLKPNYML